MNIFYRVMTLEDCNKLNDIDASQYINNAWREIDGKRVLIHINYQDPTWPNGFEVHQSKLRDTVENSGIAIGAFDENEKLLGFGSINNIKFGEKSNYALLDQLFISLDIRGKGVGKKIFYKCVEFAKDWNMDKILICAGSAEETVGFYHSLGCKETEELHKEFYDEDPRDLQLEYKVSNRIKI